MKTNGKLFLDEAVVVYSGIAHNLHDGVEGTEERPKEADSGSTQEA